MADTVRIWYVSAQRLCNFRCPYCVSINDYAKSNSDDWSAPEDRARFERIVSWIADRPFRVGVRLATLGEPFASRPFLAQAAWLSTRPNVDFVDLLTNGSLLKKRLGELDRDGDISKISLWVTHHDTEISVARFIENARFAQEKYGCFVVVNALLFPDNEARIAELKEAAEAADLRFNLDLGYDSQTPHAVHSTFDDMVPVLKGRLDDGIDQAIGLGANPELLRFNLAAMHDLRGKLCSAGHNYFYIGIRGDVYRCSRYQVLDLNRLGNVLDDGFELRLEDASRTPCEAGFGCCNKEDFLNLRHRDGEPPVPSLGWLDVRGRAEDVPRRFGPAGGDGEAAPASRLLPIVATRPDSGGCS